MVQIGYALSSEEHGPRTLLANARRAEDAGFTFALISDHYHPWTPRQGHSPFVWSVIGGIASTTRQLRLGTGVTCPLVRIHPAIVAQAAATAEEMMPGRFFLGLGTGERLNEHILGGHWPPSARRLEMLTEAIHVIRHLWQGGERSFAGTFYTVEDAEIFTLPHPPPPIFVAAQGRRAARLAGELGDGMIALAPDAELVRTFREASPIEKPRVGMLHVCHAESVDDARKIAHDWWPNSALPGEVGVELSTPRQFEQAANMVGEDDVAERVVCGPDPEEHALAIRAYATAGFDHVYVHQIGPEQEPFFDFYQRRVFSQLS